ncbi:MAG TPA: VOC family protein [Burkholderiales bacterium]|jgi:catechol 2,3-dioxygenase-like lactoylglutathione lyase family enzyme
MDRSSPSVPRRAGVTAVHSLHRFVFTVPDLDAAQRFYTSFGLDARRDGERLDLYTFGHPHRWGSIHRAPGSKKLQYLSFAGYHEDLEPLRRHADKTGATAIKPHPLADEEGLWLRDPDGIAVQVLAAPKVSPDAMDAMEAQVAHPGTAAAPSRSAAPPVRPRRLSHVLLFSSDVQRSARFYCDTLGLRLSDKSGDVIAFLHGAHASDHHMLAFAKSEGPGLHHSSWVVGGVDQVGMGMEQMTALGYTEGWGVGRHVIGSNYFRYVRDPWGSFAEYSAGIDFIPADVEWKAADHPLADSFYVWGPPPPDYFVVNHELARPA